MHPFRWGFVALIARNPSNFLRSSVCRPQIWSQTQQSKLPRSERFLPEHVMEKFCAGQYVADIIDVKDEIFNTVRSSRLAPKPTLANIT